MNARFVLAFAVVSGLIAGGAALLTAALASGSKVLVAAGALVAVLAAMGFAVLGRAVVVNERERRSHSGA